MILKYVSLVCLNVIDNVQCLSLFTGTFISLIFSIDTTTVGCYVSANVIRSKQPEDSKEGLTDFHQYDSSIVFSDHYRCRITDYFVKG